MKWTKSEPKKDGTYLTYIIKNESMGLLLKIEGKWYAKLSQGVVPIPNVKGIDYFSRITRPRE
jgi:hypothetical protein